MIEVWRMSWPWESPLAYLCRNATFCDGEVVNGFEGWNPHTA